MISNNVSPIAKLCSFLILLSFTVACNAQDNPQKLTPNNFPADKGDQIAAHIFDIFEDSNGNIWFGTSKKGVVKYNPNSTPKDGNSLTYYNESNGLCGSSVANIAEDEQGNLWFGTHMDLCKYNGTEFKTLARKDGIPILGWGWKTMGAGWKSVRSNNDKSIWVNSHHGMFRCDDPTLPFDQLTFTEFIVPMDTSVKGTYCNTPGKISLDLEDRNGNLWFGTDGDGAYKYDGTAFTHFSKADGLLTDNVTNITEDANGNIWFACVQALSPKRMNDGGVCMYDGKEITSFIDIDGLTENDIHTIYQDKSGNIWIGAKGVGVYRYDASEQPADDKKFTLYREPKEVNFEDTFNTTGLQSILEDSKGNIWMGFSGGLFRLKGTSIVNVTVNGPW